MSRLRTRTVTFSVKQNIMSLVEQYPKYAWILHDKDVNKDTGELIEPHYHVYLQFPNARSLNSIAEELEIPPNMVEVVRSKHGILNYLTHSRSPEKYQYDVSEVHSNFEVKREDEPLTILKVFDLLEECNTVKEYAAELMKRGLQGNPLSNARNINAFWYEAQERKNGEE